MSVTANGIARRAFARWAGEGAADAFRDLNIADADFPKLGIEPGGRFHYKGHVFRAVRARSALVNGGIVKQTFGLAARTGNVQAVGNAANICTAENLAAGDLVGGYAYIYDGTGKGQIREILSHNTGANTIAVIARKDSSLPNLAATSSPDAWDVALVAGGDSKYILLAPWEVTSSTATDDFVVGVAMATVTSGNWTIICEKGPAVLILCKGDVANHGILAQGPLVPSGTADCAYAPLAAAAPATVASLSLEMPRVFAMSYDAETDASQLVLCHLFGHFAV